MTRDERQQLAINRWKAANCRGTIVASTGFGKTRTALMACQRVLSVRPDTKITIVVPTLVLKNQWIEELQKLKIKASVIVINTACRKEFECNFLIIDEIHRAAANTTRQIFENSNPRLILGLTATFERLDGKEKEVLNLYAPVCDEITLAESKLNNWVAPYKEYKVLINCDLTEYNKAQVEFMQHFAFFNYDFNLAMKCSTNFWAQQVLARNLNCTAKEVKAHAYSWLRALKFRTSFIANHPKKIEIAKHILEKRPEAKAITFNSSIKQCEAYKMGYVIHSKQTKKTNSMTLEQFAQKDHAVVHSAKSLLEGVDIKGLNLAIITGFNSSKINHIQAIGRAIRVEPNKEAEVFILILKGTQEEKWIKKAGEGADFIEINEDELDKILDYESLDNKKEIEQTSIITNRLILY